MKAEQKHVLIYIKAVFTSPPLRYLCSVLWVYSENRRTLSQVIITNVACYMKKTPTVLKLSWRY